MEWLGWIIAGLLGVVLGILAWRQRRVALSFIQERARIERRSRSDAASIRKQAAELREQRSAQERQEERLNEKEDRLAAEAEGLATRSELLEQQRTDLRKQREELAAEQGRVQAELERVAGLTATAAQAEVMAEAARQARLSAATLARDIEETAKKEADQRARAIVVTAIQRCAAEQTSESVVSSVDLPGDEMKGRIIGREGRNIRAFEQITGVNVMVDDTPETVLLSCFDPVRREAARLTLMDLVADGRIHPARIEEVHARSIRVLDERIRAVGNEALLEVGIADLHPELIPVVGSLAYRTSFGQNVLAHLIECSHLAGVMAAELGLDVAQCKRAAFLHDIGKALTHESEGPHAIIGADLLRRHGEHPDVVHAVEAHHNEVEPRTVEAILTQAEGVPRAYAMQAGREVRIMVAPEVVDDAMSRVLAREIAAEVEANLTYPGQIRITVVRESRATELAH